MKKIISILIIAVLLVSVLVLPANAVIVDRRYGDINRDNKIDIMDGTEILRYCARLVEFDRIEYMLADFDNDEDITVLDTTNIQMYIAKLIDHPRKDNDWLEFYAEIDDIDIKPYRGTPLVANKSIVFTVVFDEVCHVSNDKNIRYDYTFTGITDKTYSESYRHNISSYPNISWSFPSAGIYEIKVDVYHSYYSGRCTYTKQFEVLPEYEFDGMRFVDYNHLSNYWKDYPQPPEGTSEIGFEYVFDCRAMDLREDYGLNTKSERFVALIHTKEEYDKLFEIDNTHFDDEFFKEKSLVVAVSPGYDHYDYSSIKGISFKDDVMYIKVVYGNSYPDPMVSHPTAPTWYSFASVDKADVENIARVQRV